MTCFDSHAHYNNERFDAEWEGGADALLSHLFESGISAVNNVGWDLDSSRNALLQARRYPRMIASAGIHPCDSYKYEDREAALAALEALILDGKADGKIRALGEIGYDYHYDDTDRDCQRFFFDAQMALAKKLNVPVVIHDRDAHGDTLELIRRHPDVRGVLHSYSGSAETARELLGLGYMLSFTGVVTFKNADRLRAVVASVPLDRMMIETDCPYLAPVPHRGELNHSGNLPLICETIAQLHHTTKEEVARITEENARRFFGLAEE